MKNIKHKVNLAILITIFISIYSCKEDPSSIGIQIQPNDDQLQILVCDTISIEGYSYIVDSLNVKNTKLSLLGSLYDPVFGVTTASIYSSFSLSSGTAGHDFGENPVLDSLVLMLQYDKSYGDTATMLSLHAYKMLERLEDSMSYYSHSTFEVDDQDLIVDNNFYPHPNTKVSLGNDTVLHPAHARLRMSDELGNELLNASETQMENNDSFMNLLKGLYLTVDKVINPNHGSVSSFNLTGKYSRLRLYYHNSADTAYYDYIVTNNTNRSNHFNHYDYNEASTLFKQQVLEGNNELGQQQLYLQSMAGVRTILKFPNIANWDKIIVNDAKLIIKANESNVFSNPNRVYINGVKDDDFQIYPISDFTESQGTAYSGGIYNKEEQSYSFRLSKYFQKKISGSDDSTNLALRIPDDIISGSRLVFYGSESMDNRMFLRIIYTKN